MGIHQQQQREDDGDGRVANVCKGVQELERVGFEGWSRAIKRMNGVRQRQVEAEAEVEVDSSVMLVFLHGDCRLS